MLSLSVSFSVSYLTSVWGQISGAFFSDWASCSAESKDEPAEQQNQQNISMMAIFKKVRKPAADQSGIDELLLSGGNINQSKEPVAVRQL